ncbi:MAG: PAS domain S-box protein, partial [Campylobacterales bacterium]|nr:PAS domain S-box protein [Campylobacterales bacterium]
LIHANEILQEQKKSLEAMFENAHDGIILIKQDKIINCNKAVVDMFALSSKKDIINSSILDISSQNQIDKIKNLQLHYQDKIDEVMHYNSTNFQWVFKDANDVDIYTEVTLSKIIIDDSLIIHSVIRDISQKIKYEQESLQKDMILVQQSKMASMGEMIGNIAHQWRQPLNALGLTIQKIKMYHDEGMLTTQKLDESVEKSKKLINKMSTTIDDFRNFFKSDKTKHEFFIKDCIEDILVLIEASFKNNNIDLLIDDKSDNVSYIGLKNELEQVILNLLKNAKDALVENKITTPKIIITIEKNEKDLTIKIKDNAKGIKDDIIDKIFEPYFTTKEQGKGTGIGLYMSKMIIETNMGGTLSVQNKDDGACFTISLPR